MGTEVILNPGDWVFVEDPGDDIRNAGEEDVVLLVAGLSPIGVPFTTFMPDMEMGERRRRSGRWRHGRRRAGSDPRPVLPLARRASVGCLLQGH